ncbi:hypothetical protein GCM10022223_17670 [Kineosporia mesophila]|uniref:Uncharacterized protein n=1 Tax=Kineosporia mesophila TaxID=566012 RepID=A0ABP6Z8Z8_9ACTN|nr:hypothetical protein [Kineosporia mesophila]MCD5351995.1 hypothetical protein [Kineosporia mesophila]
MMRRRYRGERFDWVGWGVAAVVVLVLLVLLFCWWAFHGSVFGVLRTVWASSMWKALIVLVVLAIVGAVVDDGRRRRRLGVGTLFLVGLVVLPSLGVWGGYFRAAQLSESITVTEGAQPAYAWRTPWAVAASAVTSRAGSVVGTFEEDATTFLPATGGYVTPVRAKGWVKGFDQVVVQTPGENGENTVKVCNFDAQVPVARGWFQYNLRRALSFVGGDLMADPDDVWVYCEGSKARLVVPVTRYTGFPEQHEVPAGVVVFEGDSAVLDQDVTAGELPGPVYPMSLAAKQREASHAENGFMDRLFRRSGYETVGKAGEGPDAGNESELLLRRTDSSRWDFVTGLTPRGTSTSVTAVSTMAADEVHDGKLNTLTVHSMKDARQGNAALANAIIAAFPQLNWNANQLTLKEVAPTSSGTWTASITKTTTVTRLVEIAKDGAMCLTYTNGDQIDCVDAGGNSEDDPSAEEGQASAGEDLKGLSNEELAELQRRVADEFARRLGADGETAGE